MRLPAAAILAVLFGCGGQASLSSAADAAGDSVHADAAIDAGTFACGDATCNADSITICFYPGCGCLSGQSMPPSDAGACPDGSVLSDAGTCTVPLACGPPSCTQLDPSGAFCSGQDGTLSGGVYPPLPSGSGRICHTNCL